MSFKGPVGGGDYLGDLPHPNWESESTWSWRETTTTTIPPPPPPSWEQTETANPARRAAAPATRRAAAQVKRAADPVKKVGVVPAKRAAVGALRMAAQMETIAYMCGVNRKEKKRQRGQKGRATNQTMMVIMTILTCLQQLSKPFITKLILYSNFLKHNYIIQFYKGTKEYMTYAS